MSTAELLGEYLDACRAKRFAWSDWNCVHYVAGWVLLAEGTDVLLKYPKYPRNSTETALRAARVAQAAGGLLVGTSEALCREYVPAIQARVGDVVYSPGRSGAAGTLAICNGATAVALAADVGVVPAQMQMFTYAWKIQREA